MKFGVAFAGVAQCRRAGVWIFAPADLAHGETVGSFDAVANGNIGWAAFARGTGPDVVDADAANAAGIFERIGADAVGMRKHGARVGARAAENPLRFAKPVAQAIEMMDRHDAERDPSERLLPVLEMRNAAH